MARRKLACDFCESELFSGDMLEGRNGFVMWQEVYPGISITVVAQANTEDGEMQEMAVEIPMKYCPNCGRRLE